MSSNIPQNSPPAPVDNGSGPQPMWMPYGFVQFDGNFNNNAGNNQISQPQGMSAYGGVIFQQPFQSPQIPNDPNRPNSLMIPPPYPLISSPPPTVNFPNGVALMTLNMTRFDASACSNNKSSQPITCKTDCKSHGPSSSHGE